MESSICLVDLAVEAEVRCRSTIRLLTRGHLEPKSRSVRARRQRALIDGKVYLAGGIVGNATTSEAAVYDPVADSWQVIASMIDGVNHAASATDGTRFYVFGGRTGGNVVGNGFDYVQIYDPIANTWSSSSEGFLSPVPESRGGTGKAVFINGEFYVFGGETANSPEANASRTYDRVDIYRQDTNTWRLGVPMPTARHGIFPVEHAGVVYLAGGGTSAGFGQSNLLEAYYVDAVRSDLATSVPPDSLVLLSQFGIDNSIAESTDRLPADPLDTNKDGKVTSLDSLLVINAISRQSVSAAASLIAGSAYAKHLDVNRDGRVSSLDSLLVINALSKQTPDSEAESATPRMFALSAAIDHAINSFLMDDEELTAHDEESVLLLANAADLV